MVTTSPYRCSIADLKRSVTGAGSHFFDAASMQFFRTRTRRTGWFIPAGEWGAAYWVCVTSEQYVPLTGPAEPRAYTVRCWYVFGLGRQVVEHHDEFQRFATLASASRHALLVAHSLVRGAVDV
jgi:hypothetical protein